MKTTFTTALLASAFILAVRPASADINAGPTTNSANGHIYYLLTPNSWTASEAEAQALGGHLATVGDASENTWIFNTFGNYGGIPRTLWIGLTDGAREGDFVWTSGSTSGYRNWAPGEPNNSDASSYYPGRTNENFVFIFRPGSGSPGKWNDSMDDAHGVFGFVCGVVEIIPGTPVPTRPRLTIDHAVEVMWTSEAARLYQLQWSSQIDTNLWTNFGNPVVGTGSTNSVFDRVSGSDGRFYRVLTLY